MARSTGPLLAVGAITLGNEVILNEKPMNWKIPIATGLAAGLFVIVENAWPDGAVALAWMALATVVFVRIDPATPSPVENLLKLTRE